MRKRPPRPVVFLAALSGLVAVGLNPARAQDPVPPARLVGFTIEPQAPEFGQVFQLGLTVRLAPGVVVFLPDTLVAQRVSASAGIGEWSTTTGPADSIDVLASYPVMGLLNGDVELPSLEIWIRPAAEGESPGARSVAEMNEPPAEGGPVPASQQIVIPTGLVQILPLSEMTEAETLAPRPPADVLGGDFSLWLVAAIALAGGSVILAAWLLVSRARERRAAKPRPPRSPRLEALRELDRIDGLGWLEEGRLVEFYDASTGVLRQFSEQYESDWGIALTSTELLERLRDRWGLGSLEDLGSVVWTAERVKVRSERATPNSSQMEATNSETVSRGFRIRATSTRSSRDWSKALIRVVLPVPTSPVSSTKPPSSPVPYSRCASASWWRLLRYR